MEQVYEVLVHTEDSQGLKSYLEKMITAIDSEFVFSEYDEIESAIDVLNDGESDLILLDGNTWHQIKNKGGIIAAVLPRREPTLVMVSEDKPEYLPSKAIVSADGELVKRQIQRLREDLSITDSLSLGIANNDAQKKIEELESKRNSGEIDAHICTREEHAKLSTRSRRHTLGFQRETDDRQGFIPPALGGFAILLARKGFPVASIVDLNDQVAQIELVTESAIFDQVKKELREITGVNVQLRRVSAIMREAEKRGDEAVKDGLLDFEGVLIRKGKRLHMCMETLSYDGKVTARAERIVPIDDANLGIIRLLEEHATLVELLTSDIEAHPRHGEAAPSMMNLDSHSSS